MVTAVLYNNDNRVPEIRAPTLMVTVNLFGEHRCDTYCAILYNIITISHFWLYILHVLLSDVLFLNLTTIIALPIKISCNDLILLPNMQNINKKYIM